MVIFHSYYVNVYQRVYIHIYSRWWLENSPSTSTCAMVKTWANCSSWGMAIGPWKGIYTRDKRCENCGMTIFTYYDLTMAHLLIGTRVPVDWHPWKKNLYRAISIMGCDSTHGFCLLLTCLDLLKMICYFLNGKPTAWWIYSLCLICCWGPLSKAKLGFTLCWSNIAMDKPPFTDDFILFVYKPPFIVFGLFFSHVLLPEGKSVLFFPMMGFMLF